jgi:cell division septation protein DedD
VQHRLTKEYPQVWVSKTNGTSPRLYRVRLGPFPSRIQAERVVTRMRALGYSSSVVPMP